MITSTHTIIADALLSFIEESTGFRLKKNKFRYGCIKPDVVPKLIATPHYYSDSFPFVMDRIEKIATLSRSKKSFRGKFSEELGVVVHYLSDFFCSAHNEKKYDKLRRHMTYEAYLAQIFEKRKKHIGISENPYFSTLQYDEIGRYIRTSHAQYRSLPLSMENDYLFSLGVCAGVCLSVVASVASASICNAA